jgi:hypothetical protein
MARRKQETEKLHFLDLPDEASPDYFRIIVRNCIVAYSRLFNDKLALDYNKVIGKTRALVLADIEYQRETRSIYSKRMWEEVEEIERLVTLADGMGDDEEEDENDVEKADVRNKGKQKKTKKVTTADKDMLNMQFKALQARRDMLNLSADNEKAEEIDALNIMYIPLTREEFERLKAVEVFEGTDDSEGTFGSTGGASKAAPIAVENKNKTAIEELYTTDADGNIIEL